METAQEIPPILLNEPEPIDNLARAIYDMKRGGSINLGFDDWARLDNQPKRMQRDLTADDPSKTGYYLVTQKIPDVLDALRPVSMIGQLPITVISGLTGAVTLPRVNTGTAGVGYIEYGAGAVTPESDPGFGAAGTLRPLRITTHVHFSRQLLAQSSGQGISDILKRDIAIGIAQQMDQQIITGGTGTATGQCQGILAMMAGFTNTITIGANHLGTAVAATGNLAASDIGWNAVTEMQRLLEITFARPDHWLIGPGTAKVARIALRGGSASRLLIDVDPIQPVNGDPTRSSIVGIEMLGKYPVCVTPYLNTVENMILGQWNLCYICVWGTGIELIVDPYSSAAQGEVQITGNLMWNFAVRHPSALVLTTDAGNQ